MPVLDRSALFKELPEPFSRTVNDGIEPMLRIDMQSANSVATLICTGRLVLGVETETLRSMVLSRKERDIRVDLSAVEKIDASGLGLLVELQAWAQAELRSLIFANLSEDVWRLVIITRLYDSLEISDADLPELSIDFGRDELIA